MHTSLHRQQARLMKVGRGLDWDSSLYAYLYSIATQCLHTCLCTIPMHRWQIWIDQTVSNVCNTCNLHVHICRYGIHAYLYPSAYARLYACLCTCRQACPCTCLLRVHVYTYLDARACTRACTHAHTRGCKHAYTDAK